jgi:hypothetical protein
VVRWPFKHNDRASPVRLSSCYGHRACGSRAHHAHNLLTHLPAYVSRCVVGLLPPFFSRISCAYMNFIFNHTLSLSITYALAHMLTYSVACSLACLHTRLFTHSRVFPRARTLMDARYVLAALGGCLTVMWEVLFPVQQARGQDQVARSVRAFWHRNLSRFPLPEEVRFPLM